MLLIVKSLITKDKRFLYEQITKTENISTIQYEQEDDKKIEISEEKNKSEENKKEDEDVRNKKNK